MSGWGAPWPLEWGGGPTLVEQAHASLLATIGKGHGADADGVEQRWREAKAVGLACLMALPERAVNQFYPRSSADLGSWRRSFQLSEAWTDEQARRTAHLRYFESDTVSIPDLTAQLQRIDARFTVLARSWAESLTTMGGRPFTSFAGTPVFGNPSGESLYPNMSSRYEINVMFNIGGVSPDGELEKNAVRDARDYLQDALPCYYDFRIVTGTTLLAGSSPVGWTVL